MNKRLLPEHGNGSLWRVLALSCLAASSAYSQSGYSYPPPPAYAPPPPQQGAPTYPPPPPQGYAQPGYETEYVSPVEFLPTFGRKFGNMFRRVFYGDTPPADYHASQGHAQSERSLDNAPPSYQSHYGQQPPPRYQEQPQYQQPAPRYQQPTPQYQQPAPQPGAPQYQTPPPQRQSAPQYEVPPPARTTPPNSRMGTQPAPRTSLKSKETTPPKTTSTPPKRYTPPTLTKKNQPKMEEMPPPSEKKETAAAKETEYYPLPGAKPDSKTPSKSTASSSSSSTKSETKSTGNTGSFLKGKRASKPGRVISPYPPYQELDITGLNSGSLALDPTTQKVFEVP